MRKIGLAGAGALMVAGWIGGCSRQPLLIPVEVSLSGSSSFEVQAGVPTTKSINVSNTNTSGLTAGQGNLELDPSEISINRANGGGKIRVQAQTTESCTDQAEGVVDTCLNQGLSAAECEEEGRQFLEDCLSGAGQIEATVWITSFEAEQAACASGSGVDTYGPYTIQLDENDNVTSVSGSPQELTASTIEWFNTVGLRICIEIVAGFDGEVVVDSLTFNVGL